MNIIILGAGQVGGTLAESLVREDNDITIVDTDAERLTELQNKLDIRTICGSAAYPEIIEEAGAKQADMLIAVTNSDEVNMIGCQVAYSLFQTPRKIARVRSHHFTSHPELFQNKAVPIDVLINPEQLVTQFVHRIIQYPGTLQVLDFADGLVQLIALKPKFGGVLVGKSVAQLYEYLQNIDMRVVAIYRRNKSMIVDLHTIIEVNDEVFIIATPVHIRKILSALGRQSRPYQRIMIAGGGRIGYRLAKYLENDYQVKIIDHNQKRTEHIAANLDNTMVLYGDSADSELLSNENIEHTDVYCAMTNDDEVNIMSCLQAKKLGARHAIALINRTAYVDLIEGSEIDNAISPQQATTSSILTHLRQGDIVNVYSLRKGAAEAIEIIAHGNQKNSKVIGRKISDIKLPPGTVIGAIVREQQAIIADNETVIAADDHIILFVVNKRYIHDVERLFQVHGTYFL